MVIEHVQPEINQGQFPIKRIIGEKVTVTADIFADGHDQIKANLLFRQKNEQKWQKSAMTFLVNDFWQGKFTVSELVPYEYTLEAWVDPLATWWMDIQKKITTHDNIIIDLKSGLAYLIQFAEQLKESKQRKEIEHIIAMIEKNESQDQIVKTLQKQLNSSLLQKYPIRNHSIQYHPILEITVDRPRAGFSAWYEMFPRSCSSQPGRHGTFFDCMNLIPEIAQRGFDVLYFPPIHPIGYAHRKGKNNAIKAQANDPGSPWAIGNENGGHMAIHPELGTLADFQALIKKAREYKLEIALDLALQCSPDHPYVREHPEWFKWRIDGTIQYAENPPKKYEDIVPIHFETEHWSSLWEEIRKIVFFWIDQGIRIFRVDNPHTKPFTFWEWLIGRVKKQYPEVIFLAEAFTRPKIMYRLAKSGFTQSYTYFTWRNTKQELTEYLKELTQTEVKEYFRPNFWPNTPDILNEYLQFGGRPAFLIRLILAATLSSNYGIYGPPFERFLNQPAPGKEEYIDSEKYEIKNWSSQEIRESTLELITKINLIRKKNPVFHIKR